MFSIIVAQVLKMFVIIVAGFTISKVKLVNHEGNAGLSNLLLFVVNPLMIFNSFMSLWSISAVRFDT